MEMLANKTYYQSFISLDRDGVLSLKQLSKRLAEASDAVAADELRFVQGEIYYLFDDYETAIFKWNLVKGRFSEWAKKNMGDAYLKQGLFDQAEVHYLSVVTEEKLLEVETLLGLFSLYKRCDSPQLAIESIKSALHIDRDYKLISHIAQGYYEELGYYEDAVKLSVDEYKRTQNSYWFEAITRYIEVGIAEGVEPSYFIPMLPLLVSGESSVFHHFVISIWDCYQDTDFYNEWLAVVNFWFYQNHRVIPVGFIHNELLDYQEAAFLELTSGKYLLKEIVDLASSILTNSYELLAKSHEERHRICAAIVAWGEMFPNKISSSVVIKSYDRILLLPVSGLRDHLYRLRNRIYQWAREKEFAIDALIDWWLQYFHEDGKARLLIAGTFSNGKTSFIHSLLGETILLASDLPTTSTMVHLHFGEEKQFHQLTGEKIKPIAQLEQLHDFTTINHQQGRSAQQGIVDVSWPSPFLHEQKITFIDSPGFNDQRKGKNPIKDYLFMADSILFVLSGEAPFRKTERDILVELLDDEPNLEVDFLLNKIDYIEEEEIDEVLEDVSRKIKRHFGDAMLIPFSSTEPEEYMDGLEQYLAAKTEGLLKSEKLMVSRSKKAIGWFTKLLDSFYGEQERVIARLQGNIKELQNQIQLLQGVSGEVNKSKKDLLDWIQSQYDQRHEQLVLKIEAKVPRTMKSCASLVRVDSDFTNLHHLLNEEMNRELERVLRYDILPGYQNELEDWLDQCRQRISKFSEQKEQIAMVLSLIFKGGVEVPFGIEKLSRFVEDQRVEIVSLIKGFSYDPSDTMLKLNMIKALLIGAGRFFGKFNTANNKLYDQYIKYFDTETFEDSAKACLGMISKQFPFFYIPISNELEKMFNAVTGILDDMIGTIQTDLDQIQLELDTFRSHPELIDDPIKLFRIAVRRQELLMEKE
jgi:tetratricopeptide (TPR) repeat protein